jgi:hypothetical protein
MLGWLLCLAGWLAAVHGWLMCVALWLLSETGWLLCVAGCCSWLVG